MRWPSAEITKDRTNARNILQIIFLGVVIIARERDFLILEFF